MEIGGGDGGGNCCRRRNEHISCLFPEILATIFSYLDVRDKGRAAQVCRAWRDAAYHRIVWRRVEARLHLKRSNPSLFPSLVRRGIRRVQVLSLRRSLRELVQGIPDLHSLNLSGCFNVTDKGLLHAFHDDLPSLTVLNLSFCKQISDSTLQWIARFLHNLEVLELGGCSNISSNGLLLLSLELKKLRYLNVRSCRALTDAGIGHLAGVSNVMTAPYGTDVLEHLVLQDCRNLSDQALLYISKGLPKLKTINLSFCSGVTDTGLRYLAKMPNLLELNLRSCDEISDIGIGFLAEGGSRVKSLDFSFCPRMGDQALLHISQGLFHLRSLSVCACNITDEGLCRLIRTAHDLTTLNIGQCNKLTDKTLVLISERLKNLTSIDLYGCTKITTVGLERIMQLPSLATLNLGLWHKR